MNTNTELNPVSVRLYGAFRQFGQESTLDVSLPLDARVADLRVGLAQHYAGNDSALALLQASAFATDQAVLDEHEALPQDQPISILPPVCGG
ncbi:MAG: MoaD/ThiS family protein [Wenzhouxiangellaceae bacterium]|nr:MoaD/ThiS family protein [Wenzhouxiangellaceae bacterium]